MRRRLEETLFIRHTDGVRPAVAGMTTAAISDKVRSETSGDTTAETTRPEETDDGLPAVVGLWQPCRVGARA